MKTSFCGLMLLTALSFPSTAEAQAAVYDPTLGTPACRGISSSCDSGTLLDSRGSMSTGEPNQPNALFGCADGGGGVYHVDESIDAIRISTNDGTNLAEGAQVTVDITVWAWAGGAATDFLDIYYITNASQGWTTIATDLAATGPGPSTYSIPLTLAPGSLQAIRARFRYQGSASVCSAGNFVDHDDLVFAVAPPPQRLSFIVYGDAQGFDSQHTRTVNAINAQQNIAFAICVGDMAALPNTTEADANSWDNYLSIANQIDAPLWPVRGNHDGDGSQVGTFPAYRNTFSFITPRVEYNSGEILYYSFDYGNAHFIVLEDIESSLVPAQTAWLANDLATAAAQQADSIFVFTHFPIVGPGPQQEAGRWDTYIAPFFDAGMLAKLTLFAGHQHVFWKGEFQGADAVVGPSVARVLSIWDGRTLGPGELYQKVNGFLRVDIVDSQVNATAFDPDGVALVTFPLK